MDGSRFDALTKALAESGSRRRALGGFLAGALALLGGLQTEEVAAKKCNQKNKKKRRQCRKRATQTTTPPPVTIPTGGVIVPPPPTPVEPTCSDTVKNGSESDVDCGGPVCLRCAVGKSCSGAADCSTSFCVNNVCTTCTGDFSCRTGCACTGGACSSNTAIPAAICADCPRSSYCYSTSPTTVNCHPPCD